MNRILLILVLCLTAPLAWASDALQSLENGFGPYRNRFLEAHADERVSAPRIEAVARQLEMKDVTVVVLKGSPFGWGGYVPGLVILDSRLEAESPEVIAFVLAHEYGHHTAQHWRAVAHLAMTLATQAQTEDIEAFIGKAKRELPCAIAHQHELDADRMARDHALSRGLWGDEQVMAFFVQRLWQHEPSPTHPATLARLRSLDLVQ